MWTEIAGLESVASDQIGNVLDREWTFAEDGIEELEETLGLAADFPARDDFRRLDWFPPAATLDSVKAAALSGYEAPLPWMSDDFLVGEERIRWRDSRFVLGIGGSFVGVWDREHPDMPIQRFRKSRRGAEEAREVWGMLLRPRLREQLQVAVFEGYVDPVEGNPELIYVGGRVLKVRDSRFVLGYGEDFIGIWDREGSRQPIQRFEKGPEGEGDAYLALNRLLLLLLSSKVLRGERLIADGIYPFAERVDAPAVWLLVEEETDERWPPHALGPASGFFLYVQALGEPEMKLQLTHTWPTQSEAQRGARRWGVLGEWTAIPETVPRTLLETARWAKGAGRETKSDP
jgi:hypothetical protein